MPVTLTMEASKRFLDFLTTQNKEVVYFTTTNKGCGGLTYNLGVIDRDEIEPSDEMISLDDTRDLVVDGKAVNYLIGTEIDWEDNGISSSFVFKNPNAYSCGCGQSFSLEGEPSSCS